MLAILLAIHAGHFAGRRASRCVMLVIALAVVLVIMLVDACCCHSLFIVLAARLLSCWLSFACYRTGCRSLVILLVVTHLLSCWLRACYRTGCRSPVITPSQSLICIHFFGWISCINALYQTLTKNTSVFAILSVKKHLFFIKH